MSWSGRACARGLRHSSSVAVPPYWPTWSACGSKSSPGRRPPAPFQPLPPLFEEQHPERKGDGKQPDPGRKGGGTEEQVPPGGVIDGQDQQQLDGNPPQEQGVTAAPKGQGRTAVAPTAKDVHHLHDNDGTQTGRRGLEVEQVVPPQDLAILPPATHEHIEK